MYRDMQYIYIFLGEGQFNYTVERDSDWFYTIPANVDNKLGHLHNVGYTLKNLQSICRKEENTQKQVEC